MGVDPNLFVNLETFFTMNYPKYELLFCIESEADPAVMIVKQLIERYPEIDSSLFIGGCLVGVNPKINNMQPGYSAAKHEFILISDSGIRSKYPHLSYPLLGDCMTNLFVSVKEDTLLDMMHHMRDDVGLVHQLPFTCDRDGFAATFEKVNYNTFYLNPLGLRYS